MRNGSVTTTTMRKGDYRPNSPWNITIYFLCAVFVGFAVFMGIYWLLGV